MDILKDLPSRDKENFSRYSQGSFKVSNQWTRFCSNLAYNKATKCRHS